MTDKILYRVLCDEYEEVARIFFEIKETGEQIEGSHQIQKWINNVFNENEQLKSKNRGLQSELQIFKEDITHSNLQINKLTDENEELKQQLKTRVIVNKQYEELQRLKKENEQLKKDATTLIYANQDYRQQNQNLQKQLDYIQNSINNAIKHQKTELGQKALQEIIADYNEWILGHKEAKE